ncbi:hypothetical protein CHARACLAT_033489 [Characodon lateralis]|uniref:Uncharacterized protein n=1 Tax=Characodon lateralis TaxID=208331 RepID=A0ABU7CWT4_9TELE|nr:hypothetical protein [Characodon lateralis]
MSASLLSTPQAEDLMESSLLDCSRADQHMLGNLDGILKSSEWLYTNFTIIQATSHIQMVPMSLSCAAQNCDVAMESDGKVTSNPRLGRSHWSHVPKDQKRVGFRTTYECGSNVT